MKTFSIILILALCVFGIVQTVQATPVTVTLDAVKDCEVREATPTVAYPSDPNLRSVKNTLMGEHTGYFAQFQLPVDCDPTNITEVRWQNTVETVQTGSNAIYVLAVKQAAETAAGDLNAYTWNSCPAVRKTGTPTSSLNYDGTTSFLVGYKAYTATVGTKTDIFMNSGGTASYWANLVNFLGEDDNKVLTFYYHERFIRDDPPGPCRFASIENTTYDPPQITITYEPLLLDKGIVIDTGATAKAYEEGPVSTTYDVLLSVQPDDDVTVTLSWDSDVVSISPTGPLDFTSANYDTPVTITVTPVDDYVFRGTDLLDFDAVITHTPSSVGDSGYNTADPQDATITIEDNDGKTITLTASKDVQTHKAFPDTAFPNDPNMYSAKLDPNDHDAFLWEFQFPLDCDPSQILKAVFKNTVEVPRTVGTAAGYFIIIKDAYEGDLNTYTWNTAPGVDQSQPGSSPPSESYNIDTVEATYCGYGSYAAANVAGGVFEYDPQTNPAYWNNLKTHGFDGDTNGRVQFYWHERYYRVGSSFASIESTANNGPQLEITYVPTFLQKGISIDDLYTDNAEEESQVPATYDVLLTLEPSANVTVNLGYDPNFVAGVSPSSLVFTAANYDTPQTVTVTPVDDAIASEPVYETVISHTAASADLDYQFAPIVNQAISIEDNDFKTVVLTAIADTDVNSLNPDSVFSSSPELRPLKTDPPTNFCYTYIQFEMPADFAYALGGTTFKMTRSYISPSTLTTLYLLGVRAEDRLTGEPIPEGDVNTYTWNTAPGLELVPDLGSVGNFAGYEVDEAYFVANSSPASGGSVGDVQEFTNYSTPEGLRQFINNDIGDDNKITLFIFARYLDDDVNRFASLENGTYDGPQIELVYGATPYCGQPGTVIADADFDEDCDVDIDDLQSMASEWLSDTVQ